MEFEGKVSIVMLANEATYKRQKAIMERLGSLNRNEVSFKLAQVLLGEYAPGFRNYTENIEIVNPNLNNIQKDAVKFALDRCLDIGIIHGPPGTGKTTTIVEIILQAVKRGIKVLATAPSNIAVDNLVEKLSSKVKVVRLGHPARMLPSITRFSFDHLLKQTDQYSISLDIRKEISKMPANRSNRNELNALRRELKTRDRKSGEEVLEKCDVILATCISSGMKVVEEYSKKIGGFGLVVIDEAAQALECACWVPILQGKKLILAGDHKQLPPTIISEQAAQEGLKISLMERICNLYPESSFLLEIQYRMHEDIMYWSNNEFYDNRLIADESVRTRLLEDYPNPLVLIDTSGGGVIEAGILSKYNPGEAEIVIKFCKEIKDLGINDISVITPYNAQVEILRNSLENIEIATVDGFQGREKDAIVISMVRSNDRHEVGFLEEFRRLNVAITRAKMMVCIVMDCDTVGAESSPVFLKNLCKYFREKAFCINFQEYCTGGVEIRPKKEESKKAKEKKGSKNKNNKQKIEEKKQVVVKNNEVDVLEVTRNLIQELVNGDENELKTEKLDAKQRHQIHELCQKLQLYHKSTGSGKNKCMIISKIFPQKVENVREKNYKMQIESPDESDDEETKEEPQISTKIQKKIKDSKKDEYDEDEFLANAMENACKCMYQGCNTNITIMRRICEFCLGGFCMSHGLAEVHGCGEKARQKARQNHARPPKIQEDRINALKDRIKDKINEKDNRKPKPKKKKK